MRNMNTMTEEVKIHSPPVDEYIHELDAGTLTATFLKEDDFDIMDCNRNIIARGTSGVFSVSLTFESDDGETFAASFASTTLGKIHPLLTLEDEARVVFSTKPSTIRMVKGEFEVNFIARSSTKAYPFALTLYPKVSTPTLSDIPKLQVENRLLRRQVKSLTAKVEFEEERTDRAIDAIKDLIFKLCGHNSDYFDYIVEIADRGRSFIDNAYPALVHNSDTMWNCLLENGYADDMMRGVDHILPGSIATNHMPKFYPMAIERLVLLVAYMTPTRLSELKCDSKTSVLQKIDQHLADEKLPSDIRDQWIRLRDAIIERLAQPQTQN